MITIANVVFMSHQLKAIDELGNGKILCGGVGTGKSITALGYWYLKVCGGVQWDDGRLGPMTEPRDLYIITTARKRDTHEWERECEKFGCDISKFGWDEGGTLTIDSWNNLHKYENVERAFFIFDEQRVVGSGAWVKSFIKISRGVDNQWILLSATPGDTWMDYIPVFIANGFYKNRTQFLRRHAVYNRYTRYPKVDRWVEGGYLEYLRRKIMVTMDYKKRTTPHWKYVRTDYDEKLYKKIAEDRWDPWKEEPIKEIGNACYLMRRAVNDNIQKVMKIMEWLSQGHSSRVIIFYNYDYELELLRDFLKDRGYEYAEWNGHKHEQLPTGDNWIYVVQYTAAAEGWNCTTTDTIIFFSQNYSYKLMHQAAGRIDRLNTPYEDLYYYVLVTDSPIDKAISRALAGKKKFNEDAWIKNEWGITE